jgi:spore coat polysaccharide biosynthesis predicted glycosyltransferase SpsG
VIVLANGGPRAGLGHVGRCLAVVEELEGRAAFAVEDAETERALRSWGTPVLAGGDAAEAAAVAAVALIDRREPTGAEEVATRHARGQRVCLLDDLGGGRASADIAIDPPTGPRWPPAGGRRLAGFEHVLLRREIRAATRHPLAGVDVLLSLGGSDPEGLTPALAEALGRAGVSVLSVLGPAYAGPQPPGAVLSDPRQWPRALAGARLLVGRFGHTLLEAAHLGTPALALATGERAAGEAVAFAAHGSAEAFGIDGSGDAERVAARVVELHGEERRLREMAARGPELVDGLGAVRVARALQELAATAPPEPTATAPPEPTATAPPEPTAAAPPEPTAAAPPELA